MSAHMYITAEESLCCWVSALVSIFAWLGQMTCHTLSQRRRFLLRTKDPVPASDLGNDEARIDRLMLPKEGLAPKDSTVYFFGKTYSTE